MEFIYGNAVARALEPRVAELIRKYALLTPLVSAATGDPPRSRGKAGFSGSALGERDALLITYADQLHEPDAPPLRTLASFAEQHLRGMVSGIHLLPFYPWSSDDGFSVKDYFAVDPALGSWEDVRQLGAHFDLMFDAVFNHMSAQGEWFQRFLADDPAFRDFFVTVEGEPDLSCVVRPRALPLLTEFHTAAGLKKVWTTFSADQVDLDFKNPDVLIAVLDALLFYVVRGARFIRLDAIAYLWKEDGTPCIHLPRTHRVVQLFRSVLDDVAPGVMLITETNVPHADNLSYFGDGTNEAQLVYNFALPPLVLHTLAAGNAEKLSRWAATLKLPSRQVTFFNFLASHDGIGVNPARGLLSDAEIDALLARVKRHGGLVSYKQNADGSQSPYELNINYFDALSDPAGGESLDTQVNRFMVAQAIMLSLAGVPGIYFHSLFGSRNDQAGAESSGIARRINRQKFSRADLEVELADSQSLRARVFTRCRELLAARRAHAAFHPAGVQEVLQGDSRAFAVLRISPDETDTAVCISNVTAEPIGVSLAHARFDSRQRWKPALSHSAAPHAGDGTFAVRLQPYETVWAIAH
jgi:glucosylglycerate phosphorylase